MVCSFYVVWMHFYKRIRYIIRITSILEVMKRCKTINFPLAQ